MAARTCKWGKVKTGRRKGQCRKRPLSGAAAKRYKGKSGLKQKSIPAHWYAP